MGCAGSKTQKMSAKETAAAKADAARERENQAREQVRLDNIKAHALVKKLRSEGRLEEAAQV